MKFQIAAQRQQLRPVVPTIGLLSGSLNSAYGAEILKGVIAAARRHGVNVLCFRDDMFTLSSEKGHRFETPVDTLYDLITADLVDGLLVNSSDLIRGTGDDRQRLCESYTPLPTLTIGTAFPGIPGIVTDHKQGLTGVVRHLIDIHGCRRLAFTEFPNGTHQSQQRQAAYTETLQACKIAVDPHLIVPGGYTAEDGIKAVCTLLDERHLQPQIDFDAIVAINDLSAIGAIEELQTRGIQVPADIVVTGFDDIEAARLMMPPLTTVRQPIYELGYKALELLLAALSGEDIAEVTLLPTTAVIRVSCGCLFETVKEVADLMPQTTEQAGMAAHSLADMTAWHPDEFCAEADRLLGYHDEHQVRRWLENLLNAFHHDLESPTARTFLQTLEYILRECEFVECDVSRWHGVISVMRRHSVPYLKPGVFSRAEELWQQARVLIANTTRRRFARKIWHEEQQLHKLLDIGQNLSTSRDVESLVQTLIQGVSDVQIPTAYVSFYEDQMDPSGFSRLMLAYQAPADHQISVQSQNSLQGRRFLSRQLLPDGGFPSDRSYQMFVGALFFHEERLGHVIFEFGPLVGEIYENLRLQLSSTLKGEQLLRTHFHTRKVLGLQPIIQEMMDVANQLGQASDELSTISSQMASGAEQTAQQASDVSAKSRDMRRIVRDMSKAVEEEAANIREISKTVTKVNDIITHAVSTANAANTTMESLESHSQQIGHIIKTITDIADQTDLLALNATIKAAQASKYGRGFAVVAENVKDLARETSQAAEDIESRISSIQSNSRQAAAAITQVVEHIRAVAGQSTIIASATSQQTATTHEISSTITRVVQEGEAIVQAMAEVVKATRESSERATHVQHEALELSSVAEQLHHLVQDVQAETPANNTKQRL